MVVAPDLGAVKLAEHYASLLQRPVAVVRKTRVTGATVAPRRSPAMSLAAPPSSWTT